MYMYRFLLNRFNVIILDAMVAELTVFITAIVIAIAKIIIAATVIVAIRIAIIAVADGKVFINGIADNFRATRISYFIFTNYNFKLMVFKPYFALHLRPYFLPLPPLLDYLNCYPIVIIINWDHPLPLHFRFLLLILNHHTLLVLQFIHFNHFQNCFLHY